MTKRLAGAMSIAVVSLVALKQDSPRQDRDKLTKNVTHAMELALEEIERLEEALAKAGGDFPARKKPRKRTAASPKI